ncbi:substrate-binding periplasmic protein [Bacterioplanes sanyensis]|nr:transporter substrate-binding domain-containing protein [Bacterioplanes sanyensis]
MKTRMFALLLTLALTPLAGAQTLTVVSDNWEGYTNKDGSGLYWEIVQAAFDGTGIEPEFTTMPWKRAEATVRNGDADAIVGVYYEPDVAGYRYPNWHISIEDPVVLYAKSSTSIPTPVAPQSLMGLKLAWIRGYGFNDTVLSGVDMKFQEVTQLGQGVQLVNSGRVDALLDYEVSIKQEAQKLGLPVSGTFQIVPVAPGNKLYIAFHNRPDADNWVELFDQRMHALSSNGKIAEIYKKWQVPETKFGAEYYAPLP